MTKPRQLSTSWDEIGWTQLPGGTRFSQFGLFDTQSSEHGPPEVILAEFPAGTRVPSHEHETDYAEIVVRGSIRVGSREHGAGAIRLVPAGSRYGPLVAGPEGALVMSIFSDARWPAYNVRETDPADSQYRRFQREATPVTD